MLTLCLFTMAARPAEAGIPVLGAGVKAESRDLTLKVGLLPRPQEFWESEWRAKSFLLCFKGPPEEKSFHLQLHLLPS